MKISLSKKNDERGPHCVLTVPRTESWTTSQIVSKHILGGNARLVTDVSGSMVNYRFNFKYLEKLSLAFPYAELSPGIHRRLKRAEEIRLDGMRIPKIRIPNYNGKLYDFQKVAAGAIIWEKYAAEIGIEDGPLELLNDEMGLGKTYVALAAIVRKQAFPALLAVPNNAKYIWAEVIEENYPTVSYEIYDTQEQSPGARAEIIDKRADITIVNIEALRARPIHESNQYSPIIGFDYSNPGLFDFEYEFIVLDEHHRVKTPGAQVTNGFFRLEAKQWLLMSGTPILSRPEEIWTVLYRLWPDHPKWQTYSEFIQWIGIPNPNDPTRLVAYHPDAMGELRDWIKSHSLRRRKDQVLKDLPDVIWQPKLVTLSGEERRIYNRIEDELVLEMEDGTVKNIGGALPQIIRLKQACASPELYGGSKKSSKLEELKLILDELVASGEKAIIFSQWEKMTLILKRELSDYNPAYVTGKVKNRARHEEQRKFNNEDDCHIYIGTIGANREAINLGVATYVIFFDTGWVPATDEDQPIGRSAAGGLRGAHLPKDTKVHIIILQAEDTYEQNVESILKKKRMIVDRTVERDGGKVRKIKAVTLSDIRNALSKRAQKHSKKTVKEGGKL